MRGCAARSPRSRRWLHHCCRPMRTSANEYWSETMPTASQQIHATDSASSFGDAARTERAGAVFECDVRQFFSAPRGSVIGHARGLTAAVTVLAT